MSVTAILQARSSSTRLPGKVLLPIEGKPMLEHQLARVSRSEYIDKLIVATSVEESDNEIETLCNRLRIHCFRGSLNNVLDRFYQAALLFQAEHIVRLTGDCPLTDEKVIDKVIQHHINTKADYTSNCLEPTFPDGLDVEIMTFQALKNAWENATLASEKEHVTPFIRKQDEGNKLENYQSDVDLSALRWTVDEPEDFEFVTEIYSELYHVKNDFGMSDILSLLSKKPQLSYINSGFIRNEGLLKSLAKDIK